MLAGLLTNINYKIFLVLAYSAFATFIASTYLRRKLLSHGLTTRDRYKRGNPIIAKMGGTAALIGILASIVLSQLIVYEFSTSNLLIYFFIVIIHALFGLVDDLIYTSNLIKIVSPYFMALPIFILAANTTLIIGSHSWVLGNWYMYLVAPIYFIILTNLVNTHSGFNGLSTGVSGIIMIALGIRSVLKGQPEMLFYLTPIFGATLVLWFFDKYPAKILITNVGSLMIGSAIGAFIIVTNSLIFGIIVFIPHLIDFMLYLYSTLVQKKNFESIKYGKLRKDGTIQAPTPMKLKFLLPYYFRMKEPQIVNWLYVFTAVFCIIGLLSGL